VGHLEHRQGPSQPAEANVTRVARQVRHDTHGDNFSKIKRPGKSIIDRIRY